MRVPIAVAAATLAIAAGVAGLWTTAEGADREAPDASERPAAVDGPAVARDTGSGQAEAAALRKVRKLPINKLAGQRVIVSYDGRDPPDRLFKLIRRGLIGGVIFFGANTGFVPPNFDSDKPHVRSVTTRMQKARRKASPMILRRPLLMMTDQEGGLVRRLNEAPSNSEREIGKASNGPHLARQAAKGAAQNLASVGMNLNLAPVLGVINNGDGFLGQFQRSYGFNKDRVARLGHLFIKVFQKRGLSATSKHFPGLGGATKRQNTDERPVTLDIPLNRLRNKDEVPFERAIRTGTDMIMISNATYPALDRKYPASMSKKVIQGELRERLGYEGVTITDALEAGGLRKVGNIPRRAIRGAKAGADLLLFSKQSLNEGIEASKALRRALRDGRLDRNDYAESAHRVLRLRKQLSAVPGFKLPQGP
ncbi:MAG: glycoside hydrolase family 3 N-terminal domain-containing protein [Solirubrobacterales bacterium]